MTFEEKMKSLELVIKEMENPSISLEDSLEKYTQAVKLIDQCQQQLDQAKQEAAKLYVVEDN